MFKYGGRLKTVEKRILGPDLRPELWEALENGRYQGPGGITLSRADYELYASGKTIILDDIGVTDDEV